MATWLSADCMKDRSFPYSACLRVWYRVCPCFPIRIPALGSCDLFSRTIHFIVIIMPGMHRQLTLFCHRSIPSPSNFWKPLFSCHKEAHYKGATLVTSVTLAAHNDLSSSHIRTHYMAYLSFCYLIVSKHVRDTAQTVWCIYSTTFFRDNGCGILTCRFWSKLSLF